VKALNEDFEQSYKEVNDRFAEFVEWHKFFCEAIQLFIWGCGFCRFVV
jgi:hypothetical protein